MDSPTKTALQQPQTPPRSRRFKIIFWISALLLGIGLGVGATGAGAWLWAKNYLESPKFWQDLSESGSFQVAAVATRINLFPPAVVVQGLELKVPEPAQTLAVTIPSLEAKVSVWGLLLLNLDLKLTASGLKLAYLPERLEAKKQVGAFGSSGSGLPVLPFRNVNLAVEVAEFQAPLAQLPSTRLSFKGSARSAAGGLKLLIQKCEAYGVKLGGELTMAAREGLTFSVSSLEGSLLSGNISGTPSSMKGELKLPGTRVPVPAGLKWMSGGEPVALSGAANLSGDIGFAIDGAKWKGTASWSLDLTALEARYSGLHKLPGLPAVVIGKFSGSEAQWAFSDVALTLGKAYATLAVESKPATGMRVQAKVSPFEIAEFLPLLQGKLAGAAEAPKLGKISGRAQASVDLVLPPAIPGAAAGARPSGNIKILLDDWTVDAPTILGLTAASMPELKATGMLSTNGNVDVRIEQAAFRSGSVRFVVDATRLGLRYGESFQKAEGLPFHGNISAEGSGKALNVRAIELGGPSGLKLLLRGTISDFNTFQSSLKITESRIPLTSVAQMLPKARGAAGLMKVTGQLQGPLKDPSSLYANLEWDLSGGSLRHEAFSLRQLATRFQTIIGREEGDRSQAQAFLVRLSSLSMACTLPGNPEFTAKAQGMVRYKDRALTGELGSQFSELDFGPALAALGAAAKPAAEPKAAAASPAPGASPEAEFPVNFKRSKFRLNVSAPRIRTPYLEFTNAKATVRVGAVPNYDIEIERISGRALEGDLRVSAKLKVSGAAKVASPGKKLSFSASGNEISMQQLARLGSRLSGKNLDATFFGKGDFEIQGSMGEEFSSAEAVGNMQIRDGGFRFLPVPSKVIEGLKSSGLADKLDIDTDVAASDRFEKAEAKFQLQGEKLGLQIGAADPFLAMSTKGHVTLAGHCDLAGTLFPRAKLVGEDAARTLVKGIPFTSTGESFSCGFTPQLAGVATDMVRAKVEAKVQEKVEEKVREKLPGNVRAPVEKSLKGLFGQ